VREEFHHIAHTTKLLHVEWQNYKGFILDLAQSRPELGRLIATLSDEMDEGKK